MSLMETVADLIKEKVLPELTALKESGARMENRLSGVEKRLDDVNLHLVDQSRRIDAVRKELGGRIDAVREELGGRIDAVREELSGRIDQTNGRIDEVNGRIDETNARLDSMHTDVIARIDKTNDRLNRLYEVIVRRDEQVVLVEKVERLESEVSEIQRKLAA